MTVQRYFTQRAINFDALYDESRLLHFINRLLRRGMFERVRLTVEEMQKMKDFSVLDVGSGSGRNSVLFGEAGAKKVLGIDFSATMIKLANAFSREHGMEGVCRFIRADFSLHYCEEKFDVVVALGVFDYIADPVTFLRRMSNLANRKVIASFPARSWPRSPLRKIRYAMRNCPLYFYTRQQLEEICGKAGLAEYRVVPYASSGFLVIGEINTAVGDPIANEKISSTPSHRP